MKLNPERPKISITESNAEMLTTQEADSAIPEAGRIKQLEEALWNTRKLLTEASHLLQNLTDEVCHLRPRAEAFLVIQDIQKGKQFGGGAITGANPSWLIARMQEARLELDRLVGDFDEAQGEEE